MDPDFQPTRWTLVQQLKHDRTQAGRALSSLCAMYWSPLYAFARRNGCRREDAEDAVQSFLGAAVHEEFFQAADPQKGRLRTFLLCAFKRHLVSMDRSRMAQKRGGGVPDISLQDRDPESNYLQIEAGGLSPDQAFDRSWALTLLDWSEKRLQAKYAAKGNQALFEALRPALGLTDELPPLREIAARLGRTENSVKVALFRLRSAYGVCLRETLGETLGDESEVDAEWEAVVAALENSRRSHAHGE